MELEWSFSNDLSALLFLHVFLILVKQKSRIMISYKISLTRGLLRGVLSGSAISRAKRKRTDVVTDGLSARAMQSITVTYREFTRVTQIANASIKATASLTRRLRPSRVSCQRKRTCRTSDARFAGLKRSSRRNFRSMKDGDAHSIRVDGARSKFPIIRRSPLDGESS